MDDDDIFDGEYINISLVKQKHDYGVFVLRKCYTHSMNLKKISWFICIGIFLLWGLNTLAGFFDLYYQFYWYDNMMHTLGGVILGCIGLWILIKTRRIHSLYTRDIILMVLLFVLLGGIGWEIFEYIQDVLLHTNLQPSLRDTVSDLVADLFGGCLSLGFYLFKNW